MHPILKEKILHEAGELFMRYGVRSVTMDEIARQLGISKKTLYQAVENKADLVKQVMYQFAEEDLAAFAEIKTNSNNAIEELLGLAEYSVELLNKVSPAVMYELQKYYRESWELMEQLHNEHAKALIKLNINEGKEQGLYRYDVDSEVVAKFYVGLSFLIVNEEFFSEKDYTKDHLIKQFINYHINGIASPEGLKVLEQHLVKAA